MRFKFCKICHIILTNKPLYYKKKVFEEQTINGVRKRVRKIANILIEPDNYHLPGLKDKNICRNCEKDIKNYKSFISCKRCGKFFKRTLRDYLYNGSFCSKCNRIIVSRSKFLPKAKYD